jgi:hypothetical protein
MMHYFGELFHNDPEENWKYFSPRRFVGRLQHLPEFVKQIDVFREIYDSAWRAGHPAAQEAPESVFLAFEDDFQERQSAIAQSHQRVSG